MARVTQFVVTRAFAFPNRLRETRFVAPFVSFCGGRILRGRAWPSPLRSAGQSERLPPRRHLVARRCMPAPPSRAEPGVRARHRSTRRRPRLSSGKSCSESRSPKPARASWRRPCPRRSDRGAGAFGRGTPQPVTRRASHSSITKKWVTPRPGHLVSSESPEAPTVRPLRPRCREGLFRPGRRYNPGIVSARPGLSPGPGRIARFADSCHRRKLR